MYNTNIFQGLFFLQTENRNLKEMMTPNKEQLYIQAYMCQILLQEMAEVLQ